MGNPRRNSAKIETDNESDQTFSLQGYVTRSDGKTGVHGITVEAWQEGKKSKSLLGSTLTSADGRFRMVFSYSDFVDPIEETPEVFLQLRDREDRIIHTDSDKPRRCKTSAPNIFSFTLTDDELRRHLAKPVSWSCPESPIFPHSHLENIKQALVLMASKHGLHALGCPVSNPLPVVVAFEGIVQDAWGVLEGDIKATRRFRQLLDATYLARSAQPNSVVSELEQLYLQDDSRHPSTAMRTHRSTKLSNTYVPTEHAVPLMIAAIHLGLGDRTKIARYWSIMLDQLCQLQLLGELHEAAMVALGGSPAGMDHFRAMWDLLVVTPRQNQVTWRMDSTSFRSWGGPDGIGDEFFPDFVPDFWEEPLDPVGLGSSDIAMIKEFEYWDCILDYAHGSADRPYYTIDKIDPSRTCPNNSTTITGQGFGDSEGHVTFHVWEGRDDQWIPAIVTSWSDKEITVFVPEGAGHGLEILPDYLPTLMVCGQAIDKYEAPDIRDEFEGTAAEILSFRVNGEEKSFCMLPGSELTITWSTKAAIHGVRVEILNEQGVAIAKRDPAPASGTWVYNQTNYNTQTCLKVRITATGDCQPPKTQRTIDVWVYEPPQLTIVGIEVTQAIQQFSIIGDTSGNNSAPLAGGKRTMVRVYVDSGRTSGFNVGSDPNVQPITGRMTVTNLSTNQQENVDKPINAVDCIAQPPEHMDRDILNHSVNFEIPIDLIPGWHRSDRFVAIEQTIKVEVEIEATDPVGNTHQARDTIEFDVRRHAVIPLVVMPCQYGGNVPSDAEIDECVLGLTRLPVPEHGVPDLQLVPNHAQISADSLQLDLSTRVGWYGLMGLLEWIAMQNFYADWGYTWCAILPTTGHYGTIPGMGTDVGHPRLACLGGRPATFAHELCHTRGLGHSYCGDPPPSIDSIDSRLPADGRIHQTGINMYAANVPERVPSETGELMSYCDLPDRWPSVALWNVMCDLLWG